MKKLKFLSYVLVALVVFAGCKGNLIDEDIDASVSIVDKSYTSDVALNVSIMKDNGLFDEILNNINSRNAMEELTEENKQILRFINETDTVLAEIEESENGAAKLNCIKVLFSESTVDDMAAAFAVLSPNMADEYLANVNDLLPEEAFNNDAARAAIAFSPKDIRNSYFSEHGANARGAYAANMNWDTIAWYTGFCAATVAGCVAASYGGFWVRIGGIVAATAGTASMAVQIVKWTSCSELKDLVTSVVGKKEKEATNILNNGLGWRYISIIGITAATALGCYVTPFGKAVVSTVVGKANMFVTKVLSVLPAGIKYTINGIPLTLIQI